ncbi:MAG: DUF2911 domain-containing protein [bacterium]|nr:DUF2911 domain-containing protein [bacterium]
MKKIIFISLLMVVFLMVSVMPAMAERGDDSGRKSKNGKVEGTIDGVNITIEYGRPQVKKREVWGGIVPFDQIWRTGADEATTISFSADVTVNGKKLAGGKYSLFTVPGKAEWAFVFNKVAKQWGHYKYDKGQDALRIMSKPKMGDHAEELTFTIDGKNVVLHWEKVKVGFEVGK